MPGQNLTQAEAAQRAEIVSVKRYDVHLDLRADDQTFASKTVISFAATPGADTFVDLIAHQIQTITLNGNEVDACAYHDSRIHLQGLAADNTLEVVATCDYMHTGEGMHRFVDPVDNQAYVYTQFEVPDARRVFAVFEQPDLKAEFKFTVDVPADWKVFSNSPTPTPTQLDDGGARFDFDTHPRISSYITAIVAGPYQGRTDSLTSADGTQIPLGVYTRASLLDDLDAEEIIKITKQGFGFYENQFARPYPFAKYDQIFVPEYNAGAMENAGCVTFRDEYLFRSKPTRSQLVQRANTILHELAHMWFGDLVTMKWWNDLWLNESFAEFMAYLSEAEATEFSDAWTNFNVRKEWGLKCDQLPTTHPIKADIRDLADVEVNFDGITYSKGAAVLRQLVAYVGRENFMKALNSYFAAHEWDNATLADLLGELERTSGRDLGAWSKVWLEEAGVTRLGVETKVAEDGSLASLTVVQSLPQAGTSPRPHRIKIGGYARVGEGLERVWEIETDIAGLRTEVAEAKGKMAPAFILVNDDDLTYATQRFDDASLQTVLDNVQLIAKPLPRALVLSTLWSMIRDGELAAPTYLDAALRALEVEDHSDILAGTLANLQTVTHCYVSGEVAAQAHRDVAERLLSIGRAAQPGSDKQKQVIGAFVNFALAPHQQLLAGWLDGTDVPEGLDVDQRLRWAIVRTLCALDADNVDYVERELARDKTLTGLQQAAGARAGLPGQARGETFRAITTDKSIPNATLIEMIRGFVGSAWRDPSVNQQLIGDYFAVVGDVWAGYTHHIASSIVIGMYPVGLTGRTDADVVEAGRRWLKDNEDAPRALRRLMLEGLDAAERAARAQTV